MPARAHRATIPSLGVLALLLVCVPASSQQAQVDPIHWAYAAYFGTGRYELGGNGSTYVLGVRPGWEWRESSLTENQRKLGFRFRLPIAVGAHDLQRERLFANVRGDNVGTISVVPGLEIEIPLTERWTVKPIAYLGAGKELGGGASAWIHWLGVKSKLELGRGDRRWALVNGLTRVAYSPDAGSSGRTVPFMTGLELAHPLAHKRIGGERVELHWHVSYTEYLDELALDLGLDDAVAVEIESAWELGMAFGRENGRLGVRRLRWDRVGFAYRFDSSGDFDGVRIVFKSLFDR